MTIDQALREAAQRLRHLETPMLDGRVLLKAAAGLDDAGLIARGNDVLGPRERDLFLEMVARRAGAEPVAYITGRKEFWSLPFDVTPDVLIPRGDSECLVEAVISRRDRAAPWSMIDLGAGSGCLLCALLSEFKRGFGAGVDRSVDAIAIARRNADRLGLSERTVFFAGDWLNAVNCRWDVIIANPPYIRAKDAVVLARDVSVFEPPAALYAGEHGLDSHEQIFRSAPRAIKTDGLLVVEAGNDQAAAVEKLARRAFPQAAIEKVNDLKGFPRAIVVDLNVNGPEK